MDIEERESIPFLYVKVTVNQYGTLFHQVFKKYTPWLATLNNILMQTHNITQIKIWVS